MNNNIRDQYLRRVPIKQATTPTEGLHNIIVNAYWIVTPNDEIIFYTRGRANSPQCNASYNIAISIKDRLYPDFTVRMLEAVYIPINPHDYV